MRERTSEEFKLSMLKRLSESSLSMRQFAIEEGVGMSTLHKWKVKYPSASSKSSVHRSSDRWSSEEKFTVVLECATLTETELGEYCRRKGLYPEQVSLWKQACVRGNMNSSDQQKKVKAESVSDKKRIKELERELARKEKALAEAAALLVLGKKLSTLRQGNEED